MPNLVTQFGVDRTTVLRHLKRSGIETRPPKRKLTVEDVDLAAERYLEGETLKAIAADLGVHKETLRRELMKIGVKMRNGRFPR